MEADTYRPYKETPLKWVVRILLLFLIIFAFPSMSAAEWIVDRLPVKPKDKGTLLGVFMLIGIVLSAIGWAILVVVGVYGWRAILGT